MSRTLVLLDKKRVHVLNEEEGEIETGTAWDFTLFDIGTRFDEDEEQATWMFDSRWIEHKDYLWTNK